MKSFSEILLDLDTEQSLVVEPSDISFKSLESIGLNGTGYRLTAQAVNQIYSYVGIQSRFSKTFFDLSKESNSEDVWRKAVEMFKTKMKGKIHFRLDRDKTVLGVGHIQTPLYFNDFKKAINGVFQNFSNPKEFKLAKGYYNSLTGTLLVTYEYIDPLPERVASYGIDDTDIFSRSVTFEYNTNILNYGVLVETGLRRSCTNISYISERTFRYPLKFESSEPMVESAEILNRLIGNNQPVKEFVQRLQKLKSSSHVFSLGELEYFYNALAAFKVKDPNDPTMFIPLIEDLDDGFPIKQEVARQGFDVVEYFQRSSTISPYIKSLARTDSSIYDGWNFITNQATHNPNLDADQRQRLFTLSSEFLILGKVWDCESNRSVRMPKFLFN